MELRDYISKVEFSNMNLDMEHLLKEVKIEDFGKIYAVENVNGDFSYYTEIEFDKKFGKITI